MNRYLKHTKSGRVFTFNDARAKLPDLRPVELRDTGETTASAALPEADFLSKAVVEMTKRELVAYASHEFQVVLDAADPKSDLVEQITQLQTARDANA